jgi:hypothetical protein
VGRRPYLYRCQLVSCQRRRRLHFHRPDRFWRHDSREFRAVNASAVFAEPLQIETTTGRSLPTEEICITDRSHLQHSDLFTAGVFDQPEDGSSRGGWIHAGVSDHRDQLWVRIHPCHFTIKNSSRGCAVGKEAVSRFNLRQIQGAPASSLNGSN